MGWTTWIGLGRDPGGVSSDARDSTEGLRIKTHKQKDRGTRSITKDEIATMLCAKIIKHMKGRCNQVYRNLPTEYKRFDYKISDDSPDKSNVISKSQVKHDKLLQGK